MMGEGKGSELMRCSSPLICGLQPRGRYEVLGGEEGELEQGIPQLLNEFKADRVGIIC